jgi:predicted nuclease with TOPRIM domain
MPDDELAGMVPTEAGGGVSHATPPPEPQDLTAVVQQLAAQQAQLQEMMAQQNAEMSRLRQHNDQLQAELNGAKDRKANALQHHQAPAMTEDQRWRAMHSEGGLLG